MGRIWYFCGVFGSQTVLNKSWLFHGIPAVICHHQLTVSYMTPGVISQEYHLTVIRNTVRMFKAV
jgi:hypothetical protein